MIERIIIFGAGGDLTQRYLLPALVELEHAGMLPQAAQIVGAGRDERSDDQFIEQCRRSLAQHGQANSGVPQRLLDRLRWRRADATEPRDLADVLGESAGPVVLYLALPPAVYASVADALREAPPPEGSRLVVEKPFGTDRDSARHLNQRLTGLLPEQAIFRVDHFLAKQTVQNILGLRFGNRLFEPLWNHVHLRRVEIVWDETIDLAGRAGYYDHTGALRDMLQNHLLQLLALVAMEPPASLGDRDLRDRKVDVLRATQVATRAGTPISTRARYTAGTVAGESVKDYVEEDGVDPERDTETYVDARFTVDNWRWAGVPFWLRSGKALGSDRTEVALHLRPVPHSAFPGSARPQPNVVRLSLGPDRISVGVNLNGRGDPFALERAELDLDLAPQELPAYARLLQDVLDGDPTLSIRADEAEEAWRIVEPVVESWGRGEVPMRTYPAGSSGPDTSG